MNNEADKLNPLDELSCELRAAVECCKQRSLQHSAMKAALDRAVRLDSPVRTTKPVVRFRAVLGIVATASVCLALCLLFLRPSNLWADVVKAVQAKPWIHGAVRGVKPGQSREFWISTSRACGGWRSEEQTSFIDDQLRIIDRYEPAKGAVYRLPASNEDLDQGQQFLETLHGMFRGDAELKARHSGMILKDQKRRQTQIEGRTWDEYELHFQIPSRPDAEIRQTFVVDSETHLPHSMTMLHDGGESVEFTFDYPENGPADIYALGVPKEAEVIDRVPTGDMTRILAGIQAGRDRFDDFQALVIRDSSPDMEQGPGKPIPMAFLVWKKGNRWRVELGIPSPEFVSGRMPSNKEPKDWMQDAFKKTYFRHQSVFDGKAVYKGDKFTLVATADQAMSLQGPAMPATWCYPITFNAPNDRSEDVVNLNPSDGPPNTILVTSRLLDARQNEIPFQRFWIDPKRGNAVVRHDYLQADPAKPSSDGDSQDLMDQWEQTPHGIWYPTRVNTGSDQSTWYHFFLDFPNEIPDELFKPTRRTVLSDRYPVDG